MSELQNGVLDMRDLPCADFEDQWKRIYIAKETKDRLLATSLLSFTLRQKFSRVSLPIHGLILLSGPPGTGKTSLARGLANATAAGLRRSDFKFLEAEPHALAGARLGNSQQRVRDFLSRTVREYAHSNPVIVLLDEIETLAADRTKLSLEANPVDVHRATDAVLASLDHLAAECRNVLFIATTNFQAAVDSALLSRVDLIEEIGRPDAAACAEILRDTLEELGKGWASFKKIARDPGLERVAKGAVGLDGRQIRKAVLAACATNQETALDPGRVTLQDIAASLSRRQKGLK